MAGGLVFLLPFLCNPYMAADIQLSLPKLQGVFFIGSLCFGLIAARIHYSIGVLVTMFSISCIYSGFGSGQMYSLAYFSAAIFCSIAFIKAEEHVRVIVLKAVVWSAVVSGFYASVQFFGKDPIFVYAPGIDAHNAIAFFGQKTKYGAFMAIAFGISLFLNYRIIPFLLFAFSLMATSSMTFGALLVVILIRARHMDYGPLMVKLALGIMISFFLLAVLINPRFDMFFAHGRIEIWKATIDAWLNGGQFFYTGFGPGSFGVLFPEMFQPQVTRQHGIFIQAHNDLIQGLFEFGLIGLICFIPFAVNVFKYYKKFWWGNRKRQKSVKACEAAFVAILANSLGNFPFQLAPHYLIGIASVCLLLKQLEKPDRISL